jgi:hypothetical protein
MLVAACGLLSDTILFGLRDKVKILVSGALSPNSMQKASVPTPTEPMSARRPL